MSRLASLDKALIALLVPLWLVCFALSVRSQVRGDMRPAIGVAAPTDTEGYPRATGSVYPTARSPFEASGLRGGDRLVRMGNVDLRGLDPLRFYALSSEQAIGGRRVPLVVERDSERIETFLPMAPLSLYLGVLASSFFFVAGSLILLLRAPRSPVIRAWFHAAIAFAFMGVALGGSRVAFYVWTVSLVGGTSLAFPLMIRFIQRFPHGVVPSGSWSRIWPWAFSVQGLFNLIGALGAIEVGARGALGTLSLGTVMGVAVMTGNYRRGTPVERRQIKWVLLGTYCAAAPVIAAGILSALDVRFYWVGPASWWAAVLIPMSLVVSVTYFNLFDVDRLLGAAVYYNLMLVLLGVGALIAIPRVAEFGSTFVGLEPGMGRVLVSVAVVAAVIPAHRRLRPYVDRLFFQERYALDRGITELLPTLSECRDARELTERVGTALERLLRPEACAAYAVIGGIYGAVFAEGRALPPAFEPESPLIGTLRKRRSPLSLSDTGRRPDAAPLGPFDRAALETLQAEVIVPIRYDGTLVAFLCLGPKRSGDVYTSTELSQLASVAEAVSLRLRSFDQDETIRRAHEMQKSLRRYVPGAVAEQIAIGDELASGKREVSVLFVDIRGYTSFAEDRQVDEIFSTVNRYTETVSRIVQEHGGSVVEFNGDGMMAVFGAPRTISHKERAAVEAGWEIVRTVERLPVDPEQALSVGVGIATGEAFVGNIQAVDRFIWSAIGNTTNLAARLQSLTRDLNAELVIDSATWERAQSAAAGFERRRVPIRGRRQPEKVYSLPARHR